MVSPSMARHLHDTAELRARVARAEYVIDPALVAEALLARVDVAGARGDGREGRLIPRDARDPRGPGPDGPPRPAA